MYVLAGQASADLSNHVNHKVEVMGQVQEPRPPAANGERRPIAVRPPMVRVESVRMVAESCK